MPTRTVITLERRGNLIQFPHEDTVALIKRIDGNRPNPLLRFIQSAHISTHDPTRALSKALERVSDDAQDKAVAPVEMDSRSSMH